MTYHAINRLTPSCVCDLVEPDIKERNLCSRHQHRLKLQNSRLVGYGDRSFKVAAPKSGTNSPLILDNLQLLTVLNLGLKNSFLIYAKVIVICFYLYAPLSFSYFYHELCTPLKC